MTYDELYFLYRDHVVLMLKQYMFYAYDDSARVLSTLLGYKLYESASGPAAAGPDKEKIMQVLEENQVNYVISEFGKITEQRSFKNNNYSRILESAKSNRVFPPEMNKPLKATTVTAITTKEPEPVIIPGWFIIGLKVKHDTFGEGEITSIKEKVFTVLFSGGAEKRFVFPSAFDGGFLSRI